MMQYYGFNGSDGISKRLCLKKYILVWFVVSLIKAIEINFVSESTVEVK
jgi:hypothetical protein